MAIPNTNYGDNPQQPSAVAETYLPDQLIAGGLKIVTDTWIITGGVDLQRGTLLGQQTLNAPPANGTAAGGNTGNGTITLITAGGKMKTGVYTVRMTGATTANIINPNGLELAPMNAAGAYVDPELNFTFTAGGAPMIAGDSFTIAVVAGGGKGLTALAAAVDGSQNPAAILVDTALASGGDVSAGVYLAGEFNANAMTFGAGWTSATAKAVLGPLGIFLKNVPLAGDLTATDPT